jgi:hypothetical protein
MDRGGDEGGEQSLNPKRTDQWEVEEEGELLLSFGKVGGGRKEEENHCTLKGLTSVK